MAHEWDEVWDNFNYFKSHENLHVQICHTVSIFNVYDIPEFIEKFKNTHVYFNILHYPSNIVFGIYQILQRKKLKKRL